MKQTLLNILVCAAGLAGGTGMASAQSSGAFDINWFNSDGGGGPSSGGNFTLNGTIGQPDAGAMSGGAFAINGGFWADVAEAAPRLSIRLTGVTTVILSWPNPSPGYVLQETSDLSAPGGGWTDVSQVPVVVGASKEVTLPATGSARLFRLRRPD